MKAGSEISNSTIKRRQSIVSDHREEGDPEDFVALVSHANHGKITFMFLLQFIFSCLYSAVRLLAEKGAAVAGPLMWDCYPIIRTLKPDE